MSVERKAHAAAFKAQVALAAHGGDCTVNERASHYGVHPTPIQGPSRIGAGHRNEPQNSAVPDPRNGH